MGSKKIHLWFPKWSTPASYASMLFLRRRITESIEKLCYLGVYTRALVHNVIRYVSYTLPLGQDMASVERSHVLYLQVWEVPCTLLHHLRILLMKDLKKEGRVRLLQDSGVGRSWTCLFPWTHQSTAIYAPFPSEKDVKTRWTVSPEKEIK